MAAGPTRRARTVELQITPGLKANADSNLLRIALENLLRNAWKFTAKTDNARIEVGCNDAVDPNEIFVRDNGAGFDMKESEALFEPFRRLHDTTEFPGSGVGLATVARIVERHGGRIWAEGEISKGASFTFTLPPAP